MEELNLIPAEVYKQVDIYVVAAGQGTLQQAFKLSELLRDMSSKEKTADVPRTMTTTKTWSQSRGRRKTQNVGFFALRRHSVLN